MSEIKIGDIAPAFTLFNTNKEKVSLSDYKGKKLVLLFFPLAFTSTCTVELCGVRDDIASYQGLQAEVVAISNDSPHVLKKYKEDQGLNFTLISDYNREVSSAYGTLYDVFVLEMKHVTKRAAFVIDQEGKVQYAEILENSSDLPKLEAVKSILEKI